MFCFLFISNCIKLSLFIMNLLVSYKQELLFCCVLVCLFVRLAQFLKHNIHLREGFIRKKIIVNFHNLGPDPPPKSCERQKFIFFHTLTETHFGEKNFFSPYKSIKLRKNSRFFPNISKIFGLSGKGVPPPHTEKFFLCIFA